MKKIFVVILVSVLVLIFGCAQDPVLPDGDFETISFDAWMAKNAPNAVKLPTNDDVYIEYLYRNPEPWPDTLVPRLYSWFFVNYTGYSLDGRIFVSRLSDKLHKAGTWSIRAHCVPEFSQWYPDGGIWAKGLLDAFSQMHYMDSARIYLSSSVAYLEDTMKCNESTQGEISSYVGYPVYFDVRFMESMNYPSTWWRDSLIRFIEKSWGQKAEDSIFSGCYMRKLIENPSGYQIDTDTAVYVNYKRAFADGLLIETDYDSVAIAEGIYNYSTVYGPISKTVGSESDAYMELYNRLLPYMRKGETAEFAIIAGWSPEGKEGASANIPQIMPFENTIYTMYTYNDSVWEDSTDL